MDKVAFFRDYLAKKPEDRFARYSLALELKKAGAREEAEAELRRVVARFPESGAAHLQLGQLLEEDERFEEAQAALQAGLTVLRGSSDPEARKAVSELQLALDAVEDQLG